MIQPQSEQRSSPAPPSEVDAICDAFEATWVAGHLNTVGTKGELAALYHTQRKFALAEPLYKDVLAVRTAKLGADDPDTIVSQDRLAIVYRSKKKLDQ